MKMSLFCNIGDIMLMHTMPCCQMMIQQLICVKGTSNNLTGTKGPYHGESTILELGGCYRLLQMHDFSLMLYIIWSFTEGCDLVEYMKLVTLKICVLFPDPFFNLKRFLNLSDQTMQRIFPNQPQDRQEYQLINSNNVCISEGQVFSPLRTLFRVTDLNYLTN